MSPSLSECGTEQGNLKCNGMYRLSIYTRFDKLEAMFLGFLYFALIVENDIKLAWTGSCNPRNNEPSRRARAQKPRQPKNMKCTHCAEANGLEMPGALLRGACPHCAHEISSAEFRIARSI